jgi:hypothetical protein
VVDGVHFSGALSEEGRGKLDRLYTKTNPRTLRTEIYRCLAHLWKWQSQADQLLPAQLVE